MLYLPVESSANLYNFFLCGNLSEKKISSKNIVSRSILCKKVLCE